ncbi:hypothetical protein NY2A_b216L [Paramecium bursaria Chlorella virus NY2A]|uniref:Uncharacterized protein b216L n=1 Tax=Paramecium bursaria Chlorella virus NY2A TaxID=46021 RepID=A7IW91_PBCVN|nr:hypothetical protein NY2A_b216L [Paramecium bursaria Chlorella virus NY2A]ABT14615.1 hypothetical protein NY2A_b216L [Paramecium bursaria Chlorella virus NY2A]
MRNFFVIQFRFLFERKILFPESCKLVGIHLNSHDDVYLNDYVSIRVSFNCLMTHRVLRRTRCHIRRSGDSSREKNTRLSSKHPESWD